MTDADDMFIEDISNATPDPIPADVSAIVWELLVNELVFEEVGDALFEGVCDEELPWELEGWKQSLIIISLELLILSLPIIVRV